jgi:polyhydroxyalkanoate synthesis regulator phasin
MLQIIHRGTGADRFWWKKTARELKKLLGELVDHSHGHHKAIDGLAKRLNKLERRVAKLEGKPR